MGIFDAFLDDPGVRLLGVEAGGRAIADGDHAARFAGGAPGVLHGTRSVLLQDADGNILPTHSISAGLDYPSIGPEHAWLASTGRAQYTTGSMTRRRSQGFGWLARHEGILPALESSHAAGWMQRNLRSLAAGHRRAAESFGSRRQGRRDRARPSRVPRAGRDGMSRLAATFARLREQTGHDRSRHSWLT